MMRGPVPGQYIGEGKIMRCGSFVAVIAVVVGCSAKTIDAGTNAGASTSSASPVSEPTTIASLIQRPPTHMVSDGTTLFWSDGSNVSSMPVGGGTIRTLTAGYLLSVDDVGIYVDETDGIYRLSKSGGALVLISDPSPPGDTLVGRTTTFGANAYWAEWQTNLEPGGMYPVLVKTAPLHGGPITTIGQFETVGMEYPGPMAVTANTIFIAVDFPSPGLASFSTSAGSIDGGPLQPLHGVTFTGFDCPMVSDDDAVYCDATGPIVRIANAGTTTTLGMAIGGASIALDDADVYWVDQTTVGTVMKVSKSGGSVTTLAHDTSPIAIAVDATSVYWSDMGGNIERLPK